MSEYIYRLAELLIVSPDPRSIARGSEFLEKMSNRCVVAGSAAAYAAGDFDEVISKKGATDNKTSIEVARAFIGDIDFFVIEESSQNNFKDLFVEYLSIIREYFQIDSLSTPMSSYPSSDVQEVEEDSKRNVSVVTVHLARDCIYPYLNTSIPLQFIFTDHTSARDVIESFDFGYIQVSLYKDELETGSLYNSEELSSLVSIFHSKDTPRFVRFAKARSQGGKWSLFFDRYDISVLDPDAEDLSEENDPNNFLNSHNLTAFWRKTGDVTIDLATVEVVGLTEGEEFLYERGSPLRPALDRDSKYMAAFTLTKCRFRLKSNNTEFSSQYIVTEITSKRNTDLEGHLKPFCEDFEPGCYIVMPYLINRNNEYRRTQRWLNFYLCDRIEPSDGIIPLDILSLRESIVSPCDIEDMKERDFLKLMINKTSDSDNDRDHCRFMAWRAYKYKRFNELKSIQETGEYILDQYRWDLTKRRLYQGRKGAHQTFNCIQDVLEAMKCVL